MSKAGTWALGDKIKRHHPLQMALKEIPMRNKCKKTQPFSLVIRRWECEVPHEALTQRGCGQNT